MRSVLTSRPPFRMVWHLVAPPVHEGNSTVLQPMSVGLTTYAFVKSLASDAPPNNHKPLANGSNARLKRRVRLETPQQPTDPL